MLLHAVLYVPLCSLACYQHSIVSYHFRVTLLCLPDWQHGFSYLLNYSRLPFVSLVIFIAHCMQSGLLDSDLYVLHEPTLKKGGSEHQEWVQTHSFRFCVFLCYGFPI